MTHTCSNIKGPPTLGEVERSRLKFGIKRSIPFFRKESQIVLPLDLRLDLSLRCFEMTYKNILQKFYEKPRTTIHKTFFMIYDPSTKNRTSLCTSTSGVIN